MVDIIQFQDAIKGLRPENTHLIVGNGFSRACFDNIFNYTELLDIASFSGLSPYLKEAFNKLGTADFERVIQTLNDSSTIASLYKTTDKTLLENLKKDATGLREELIKAILQHHPENPNALTKPQYSACGKFLSHFSSFFSLNYDLLLYWVLLDQPLHFEDGFRKLYGDELVWDESNTSEQNLYFLHGALQIFDQGPYVTKISWAGRKIKLVDQVKEAIARNDFPLFVAEGLSKHKMEKIRHNEYLSYCFNALGKLEGSLFIHGVAFSENDEHLSQQIRRSKFDKVFVSIFGDLNSERNLSTIANAELLDTPKKRKEVIFYSAESASVWG